MIVWVKNDKKVNESGKKYAIKIFRLKELSICPIFPVFLLFRVTK